MIKFSIKRLITKDQVKKWFTWRFIQDKNYYFNVARLKKWFTWRFDRDNNYYFGMALLVLGIISLGIYLLVDLLGIFDAFEPVSFLITFLICGWGFVLLWKSDNDYRFKLVQKKILELEQRLAYSRLFIVPPRQLKRSKR